jgi:class 3 adenylate cyclase
MSDRRSLGRAGVLFTDLVGSTELMAKVGERAFDELRREHFSALRGALGQNGRREVKTWATGSWASSTRPATR